MRFSARSWAILSVLLFVAAILFWRKGNEVEARKRLMKAPAVAETNSGPTAAKPGAAFDPVSTQAAQMPLASLTQQPLKAASVKNGTASTEELKKRFPYRLQNTDRPLMELVKDGNSVLLANALLDSRGALPEIPKHLKAEGDPGSFIVQWKGAPDREFRDQLKAAGAEIISYVPNNAYYVKLNKSGADRLAGTAGVQTVMPFEPYYKLDQALLGFAVQEQPLPAEAFLRLTLLPGSNPRDVRGSITQLGGEILAEEPSPFGQQLLIKPASDSLSALARLSAVQGIERASARKPASDLTRVTLGISADGETNKNYLDLTGEGSLVAITDTGIQPTHPTLADTVIHSPVPLRGLMFTNNDPNGHGTFVASLIAGNGANSPSALQTNSIPGSGTNTNSTNIVLNILPGSTGNPDLRGMAPNADLLALPLDPSGPGYADITLPLLDTWLIQSAAQTNYLVLQRTNTLISNNSWTYGIANYDSSAARYDQAVRDALPGTPNEQQLLFVFAAGNSGFGQDDGTGGTVDTVESPGTAKNVITVGALETMRLITNVSISTTNYVYETNELDGSILTNEIVETIFPFAEITDSSTEVAAFSSRGNVGIGIEGDFGRFKPDLVAPGTMLVSARSEGWNINTNIPFGDLFALLHEDLEPYRYDSGSTFAAATISGMAALVEEYFQSKAPEATRARLSPALMKALLINGARTLGSPYDLAVQSAANLQGWGLPYLPNSLTSFTTNDHAAVTPGKYRLRFVEQSGTNSVATGESLTWNVHLSTNAAGFPLRVTLVWTDPPGNPAVAVKLVNDLDLVVTNLESGVVFYGNYLDFGGDFSAPVTPVEGDLEPSDSINNVENVMIGNPAEFGTNFSVTVRGRRVNVNAVSDYLAVTRDTNDVVQDFALVVSSDIGADPSLNSTNEYLPDMEVFERFERAPARTTDPRRPLTIVTNGLPLLEERVGANPTLMGTNGVVGQWNFYVFTNLTLSNSLVSVEAGSNVAFVTFNPPNLSRARTIEADIDLYVSTDERLTNLNPIAVANSFKSRERGGTEMVVFTNAPLGEVFYIGVKSEDQQGAEYSLIGVSSDDPFERDEAGRSVMIGVPLQAAVQDGTARRPSAGTMIAIGLSGRRVANVRVDNTIFHENLPDLVGVLAHNQTRVILNNHTFGSNGIAFGTNRFIYNDNPMFSQPGEQRTDGPGSLNDFAGQRVQGPWFLEMIDNSPGHTGRVEALELLVDPLQDPLLFGDLLVDTVNPNTINYYPVDVPPNVTNLIFRFQSVTGGPLEFYWRRDRVPTTNEYDSTRIIAGAVTFNEPVIGGATYFMGLRNPTGTPASFELIVDPQYANDSAFWNETTGEIVGVLDNTTTNAIIEIVQDKIVTDVRVGVIMKHPRTADIVLSLVSPQGTRVLLTENRGYTNTSGFGSLTLITNGFTTNGNPILSTQQTYVVFTEHTNLTTTPVKFANAGSTVNLGTLGVAFANGFEGSLLAGNYREGTSLAGGWTVIDSPANTNSPSQISIINGLGLANTGDTLLSLGTAGIRRRFTVTPGRTYNLRFAARAGKDLDLFSTGVNDFGGRLPAGSVDPHYFLLAGNQTAFPGPQAFVVGPNQPPFLSGAWLPNTVGSQWIAPYSIVPTVDGTGQYVFRTYINMYEQDTRLAVPTFRWAADDFGRNVRLNGVTLNYQSGSPTNFSGYYGLSLSEGLNILDFFVSDTNGVEGLHVDAAGVFPVKDPNPQVTAIIGGRTLQFSVTPAWDTYTVTFTPTNAVDTLDLITQRGEVWVDTISVETSGDVFVLPEEPFEVLEGERAMGEWRIEARDTRTGAVLPAGEVLDWNLELGLVDAPNRALVLQNGDTVGTFTMRSNQVHYVVLDPCRSATFLRFTLNGVGNRDGLEVRADWSGFPTGNSELEDFVPVQNERPDGSLVFEVNRDMPAPARLRGKPLYLAIYNQFQTASNRYDMSLVSDGDCAPLTPPPEINPGDPPSDGTLPPGTGGGSGTNVTSAGLFQFVVGSNVRSATVTVVSTGDVSVFALQNEPPTSSLFSHTVDENSGAGTETLVIGAPAGGTLPPGTWYVRVVNDTTLPVNYSVSITFDYATPPGEVELTVVLINGQITFRWNGQPGVTYEVLGSNNISAPRNSWTVVGTISSPPYSYVPDPTAARYQFYVVRQRP